MTRLTSAYCTRGPLKSAYNTKAFPPQIFRTSNRFRTEHGMPQTLNLGPGQMAALESFAAWLSRDSADIHFTCA